MAHVLEEKHPKDKWDVTPHTIDIEIEQKAPCEHYFEYRTPQEILCNKCLLGYYIDTSEKLKDGHLYKGSRLLF